MRFGPAQCTALVLMLLAAPSLEAQLVHGRVTDAETGEGVASAAVLVVNPDNTIRSGAVSDAEGRFSFPTTPGNFYLRIERSGYATTTSTELGMSPTDTLDFAIRLPLRPTQVDALTVTAEGRDLDPSGFFRRRSDVQGRFLGPYEVERRHPGSPADLLQDIPGFRITPAMGGFRVLMTSRNRRCEPTVYVDGALAHRGTQTDRRARRSADEGVFLEGLVNANAIRALEAYHSGFAAPVEFRPVGPIGGGDCGVLVFWTRIGLRR